MYVLMKNKAKHSDMLDIMLKMQAHLGKNQHSEQLTCEHQVGGQRHMMDADTLEDQLQLLQPQTEDWHSLVCVLTVSCLSM